MTCLKDGGTIVTIANGGAVQELCAAKENGKCVGKAFLVQPSRTQLNAIAALIDEGKITPAKITELKTKKNKIENNKEQYKNGKTKVQPIQAHKGSETGRTTGKLVVAPFTFSTSCCF